jgi:hypothetical protein
VDTGFYDFHIAFHTVNQQSRDYAHALMSATDGYGKAAHAYKSNHVLTLLHITRTVLLVRLTPAILPPTLAPCRVRSAGSSWRCYSMMRFLGIVLYGFLQCQLILILSHLFGQIRITGLGSPDCCSYL